MIYPRNLVFLASLLPFAATPVLAQKDAPVAAIHECGGLDSIGNLIGDVRSFADGAIRVASISTEEPAAAPEHLLIFIAEEPMGVGCYAVSANADGRGFNQVDMKELKVSYDENKGLLLSVPVSAYDPENSRTIPLGRIQVRISRKNNKNSVTIER
jgi:hypothetical protein